MIQSSLNAWLFSLVLISLTSCASTPEVRYIPKVEKICPEPSLYDQAIPDGLTDEMDLQEITVSLSLALGQANADREQVKFYCEAD